MSSVDQFQSVFRAADKAVFHPNLPQRKRVLIVSDLEGYPAEGLQGRIQGFLGCLGSDVEWSSAAPGSSRSVKELLDVVEENRPDLVCTYRNLHSEAWRWPFSLGVHLDVLTQATEVPVLVLPHPESGEVFDRGLEGTERVMAVTGHLQGDDELVNEAAGMTAKGGTLWLAHIEDEADFERIMGAISKIPSIDTEPARELLRAQLLKEPRDFIKRCRAALAPHLPKMTVEEIVTLGSRVADIKVLVEEHRIQLLVLHTKDNEQLAMHGLAYPLAIELRETPLLLL